MHARTLTPRKEESSRQKLEHQFILDTRLPRNFFQSDSCKPPLGAPVPLKADRIVWTKVHLLKGTNVDLFGLEETHDGSTVCPTTLANIHCADPEEHDSDLQEGRPCNGQRWHQSQSARNQRPQHACPSHPRPAAYALIESYPCTAAGPCTHAQRRPVCERSNANTWCISKHASRRWSLVYAPR